MTTHDRDWSGLATLLLAIRLALGLAGALLLPASPLTDTLTDAGANLLSLLGGGMVAIISAYVSRRGEANNGRSSNGGLTDGTRDRNG